MLEEIMKEFKNYREAVYNRVSEFMNYTDEKHEKNANKVVLNENGLCELTEELDARISSIEDSLAVLAESATDTTSDSAFTDTTASTDTTTSTTTV